MRARRYPSRPSQMAVANVMEFWSGGTNIKQSVKRGRQKEGLTNDAIADWRALHPELLLERNKRRLAIPIGMKAPIMLGWLVEHSADWLGYLSVVVTPDMVGKRIAQFVAIEAKSEDGILSKGQESFLKAVKDAGGKSGVARNADDCENILRS